MDHRVQPPSRRPARATAVAACVLVLVTGAGGARAVALARTASLDPSTLRLDGLTVHVTGVDEVVGVAAADLMGGMAHNISGYVAEDEMMLSVSVELTAGDEPTAYRASSIVARAAGASADLSPAGGTLGSGFLSAHGRVDGTVAFVVPRDGSHLSLRVRGSSRSIPLADVDHVAPGHSGHEHGTTQR